MILILPGLLSALAGCPKNPTADQPANAGGWCIPGFGVGNTSKNLGPADFNAAYNGFIAPLKDGQRILFRAHFPHARYASIVAYDEDFMPVDAIKDYDLVPLTGVNPFIAGTPRDQPEIGEFELTILPEAPPAGARAPNTVYAGRNHQGGRNRTVVLAYRVYLADQGMGFRDHNPLALYGGVEGPRFKIVGPDGAASCPRPLEMRSRMVKVMLSILSANRELLLHPERANGNARNPPVWTNIYSRDDRRGNTFVPNDDTVYLNAPISSRYGELLVLHWRAPRTPQATFTGAPLAKDVDMRYWSLSFSYTDRSQPTVVASEKTVADVDVPTLPDGTRQIVIGFGGMERPAAVPPEQWVGVKFKDGAIVMRNILVTPGYEGDFGAAPAGPLTGPWEKFTPGGVYYSVKDFADRIK
jgi:hypothetical protein